MKRNEKIGLLTEWHEPIKTDAEYAEQISQEDQRWLDEIRNDRKKLADDWRAVRRMVQQHPQKQDILKYWNEGPYPGHPGYLKGLISSVDRDPLHVRKLLEGVETSRLMGRLLNDCQGTKLIDDPSLSPLEQTLVKLRFAKHRAQLLAPHLFHVEQKEEDESVITPIDNFKSQKLLCAP